MQRLHNLLVRAAGQVGTANRSGKQRVTGNQLLLWRKVEADAAFGVARRMQYVSGEAAGADFVAGAEAGIDGYRFRRWHADPRRLHIQHFQQGVVVLVEENRRAG